MDTAGMKSGEKTVLKPRMITMAPNDAHSGCSSGSSSDRSHSITMTAEDARGEIRTRTGISPRWILSPLRLPFRHSGRAGNIALVEGRGKPSAALVDDPARGSIRGP